MGDQITGTVGDDAENVAIGKNIRTRQNTDSHSQRLGDQTFTFSSNDSLQLMWKLQEMTADIRDAIRDIKLLDIKLDNLPDRVGRLEKLEVVVRPEAARPTEESFNLSVRMIFSILFGVFLIVIVMVGILIYIQVG